MHSFTIKNSIIFEEGFRSGVIIPNGHLATSNLVNTYFLHNRQSNFGQIDGVDKNFLSSRKIKESEEFEIIECCSDSINPLHRIKDNIGIGEIQEMSRDLKTNSVTIKLKY